MSDESSDKPRRISPWTLRRFVAYSILAHVGATAIWGVPVLMSRMAEQALAQEEKELAEHYRKEEVKAKQHAKEQKTAQTRRDVEAEMQKEFDKLTSTLSEELREDLWEDVAEKIVPESTDLAAALNNPDTSEQDLRTLEAELRRAMIDSLNEVLNAETARELADRFVDQVESQVAPELADWMKGELDKRVADKMREEAEKLIAKQREEAKKARDQALAALREVSAKADAADAAVTQAGDQLAKADAATAKAGEQDGKTDAPAKQAAAAAKAEAGTQQAAAGKQMDQAAARLGEADTKLGQATPKAANLDGKAREQVAAADTAIDDAKAATAKAAAAVKAKSPDAGAAVAEAKAATAKAQAATKSAIDAVSDQGNRGELASAAIRAAAESALSEQVEKTLTDELTNTTLPRLAGKLQEAFKKQLDQNGLGDDELVASVGKEVQERLAAAVPALAKAGNEAVDSKLGDVGDVGAAGAEGAPLPTLGDSMLDKALAEGLAGMGASAAKRVGELAANGSQDSKLVGNALKGMGAGEGDAAALAELRDTVGAMARGMGSGRLGAGAGAGSGGGGAGIGGLRSLALGRGGSQRNQRAYEEVSGQIEGREAVQGSSWTRRGAQGQTSSAEALVGTLPAQVVGESISAARSALRNDQPYTPTFTSIAFTTVPYFNGDFRIDGNLAKWDAMPAIVLKPEYGADPSVQVMKLAWSSNGLFFYCKIADTNRQMDKAEIGNFWQGDVVEIWVDAYNTKEKYRARHIGQQFWAWPFGSKSDPTLTGGESLTPVKGGGYHPVGYRQDKLERWATETPEGWIMEVRLPPALISDADLSAGRILGFNAYIGTSAMSGVKTTGWYWSAGKEVGTYGQPDTWGDLLLAGSDAKIQVLSGNAEDSSKRVMMVGEPLRLRVTDGDMDLTPTARDKVMVTLKDGHGGSQIAVLEETGASTGVFDGAVTTALALDEPVPAVLGIYEGERVDIIYTDQARANGAREAQVATSVSFGSAVMAMGGPAVAKKLGE